MHDLVCNSFDLYLFTELKLLSQRRGDALGLMVMSLNVFLMLCSVLIPFGVFFDLDPVHTITTALISLNPGLHWRERGRSQYSLL